MIRRPNIPLLVCALDFADELIHPFTVLETILQTQGLDGSSSYVAKEKNVPTLKISKMFKMYHPP